MTDPAPSPAVPEGWRPITGLEGYPALVGPFLARRAEGGGWRYAFLAEPRHRNAGGVVHGGALMSFADDALGMTVWEAGGRKPCTTVQLNTQFVSPARVGDLVEARVEVTRVTRTLIFVRGLLVVGERTVAQADGVWKILGT